MIISNRLFTINISPFTIFLIDRDGQLNPEYVERLNSDITLTGNVYRFKYILCNPLQISKSQELKYIEHCNILCRLFPNKSHLFHYMIDTLEFNCSYEFFHYAISRYISSISYQNVNSIDQNWLNINEKVNNDGKKVINIFKDFFTYHYSYLKYQNEKLIIEKVFPYDDVQLSFNNHSELSSYRQIEYSDIIAIEKLFKFPGAEDSDQLFMCLINNREETKITPESDLFAELYGEITGISVEVKRMSKPDSTGLKHIYSFAFSIYYESVSISMKQSTSAIIYLFVLLFAKAGKKLYLNKLQLNDNGGLSPHLECLQKAYNLFFNKQAKIDFKAWLADNYMSDKRKFDQGIYNIKIILNNKLYHTDKTLVKVLPIINVNSYLIKNHIAYGISLNADKIILPEEFMPIVKRIKELDFDGNNGG